MSERLDKGNGKEPRLESGHIAGTSDGQGLEIKGRLDRARVALSPARPRKVPALPRRLYDLEAIRIYLGIPVHTIREIVQRGDLPHVKIGRRQYLDIRDVDSYIEANKVREK